MCVKDLSEKLLMSYNDVFAEIWNVLGDDETGIIDPSELSDAPTESLIVTEDNVPHNMIRDISKIYGKGMLQIAVLSVENQTAVDRKMPLRVMLYNAMTYWCRQRNQKKMLPALTRIFYFGYKERWNGPRRLSEMMEIAPELKNEFEKYGDYAINIVEVAWLSDEKLKRLKGDFRDIAELMRAGRLGIEIKGRQKTLKHPLAVCSTIKAVLGIDLEIDEDNIEKGVTMENILSRNNEIFLNRGFEKGQEQGMKIGKEQGMKIGKEQGMKIGKEQGIKIGEEQGIKIGEERTSGIIVKKLHAMQMSEGFISEATQLSIEKIREILAE